MKKAIKLTILLPSSISRELNGTKPQDNMEAFLSEVKTAIDNLTDAYNIASQIKENPEINPVDLFPYSYRETVYSKKKIVASSNNLYITIEDI